MKPKRFLNLVLLSNFAVTSAWAACDRIGNTWTCVDTTRGSITTEDTVRVTVTPGASLTNIPVQDPAGGGYCPLSPPIISVGAGSTVVNQGTLLAFGTCASAITGGDNLTVISSGTIDTIAGIAHGIATGHNARIELSNSLTTRGDVSYGIVGGNNMSITLATTGSISTAGTAAAGIFVGENANIVNNGTIRTNAIDAPAVYIIGDPITPLPAFARVTNNGLMDASGARTDTVRIESEQISLINTGRVSGTYRDTNRISDYSRAAVLRGSVITVTNTGTMAGAIGGLEALGTGTTTIANSGMISATADIGRALDATGRNITLSNTGTISGRLSGVRLTAEIDADVVNSGTIEMTGGAANETAFAALAISAPSNGRLSLNNAGTLRAPDGKLALSTTNGVDTVINTGQILGDVALGSADDTLVMQNGAVLRGHLDGGTGTDRMVLVDRGVLEATSSNFEDLVIIGNGGWTLARDFSATNLVGVLEGELSIGAGRTLTTPRVTVLDRARLSGSGMVRGSVTNSGIISPGPGIATLQITGDLSMDATSIYAVDIGANNQSDALMVSGTTKLGGTLKVTTPMGLRLRGSEPFDIITSAGGITGTFAGVDGFSSTFLRTATDVSADQRTLRLRLTRVPYASVAVNARQQNVSVAVDGALSAGRTGLAPLFDQLDQRDASSARDAFAQLAVPLPTAMAATADVSGRAALRALKQQPGTEASAWGLYQNTAGGPGRDDYHFNISGVTAGLGANVSEHASINVAVSQQRAKVGYRALPTARAELDHTFVMAGGAYDWDALEISGAVLWGDGDAVSFRRSTDPALFNTTSNSDAQSVGGYASVAHRTTWNGFRLKTSAGVDVLRTSLPAYIETGLLAYRIDAQKQTSVRPGINVQLSGTRGPFSPYVGVGLSYEVAGRAGNVTVAFNADPATSFALLGVAQDRLWASLEAGVDLPLSEHLALKFGVNISPHDATRGQSIFAGASWQW